MKIPSYLLPYSWLAYPIGVLLLILFSLNFFFGKQSQFLSQLAEKRQKNSETRQTLAKLNSKLTTLKQVNTVQMNDDLGWMDQVYPGKQPFEAVVNELRFAALTANSTLTSYKSSANTDETVNYSVNFEVPDFVSAQKIIASMQSTLPLLAVNKITYSGSSLTADIISGWSPVSPVSVKIDEPLPEAAANIPQLRAKLATYQAPVVEQVTNNVPEVTNGTFVPSTDPFGSLPE